MVRPWDAVQVAAAVKRAMADAEAKKSITAATSAGTSAPSAPVAIPRNRSAEEGIDFETFLAMLRDSSLDSLDLYDDRSGSSRGTSMRAGAGVAALLDRSLQGADHFAPALQPVAEVK